MFLSNRVSNRRLSRKKRVCPERSVERELRNVSSSCTLWLNSGRRKCAIIFLPGLPEACSSCPKLLSSSGILLCLALQHSIAAVSQKTGGLYQRECRMRFFREGGGKHLRHLDEIEAANSSHYQPIPERHVFRICVVIVVLWCCCHVEKP